MSIIGRSALVKRRPFIPLSLLVARAPSDCIWKDGTNNDIDQRNQVLSAVPVPSDGKAVDVRSTMDWKRPYSNSSGSL